MKWIDVKSGVRGKNSYIYELESLRGIAIILVFLYHAYGISFGMENPNTSLPMSFIVGGNTGVTLFFVLSGFLLSLPFVSTMEGSPPSIRDYFVSRALRILPLYYATILVTILVTGQVTETLPALSFQPIGFKVFPFSVVWWTLSTEVQFYLLLPFVMLLFRSKWGIFVIIAALTAWAYFYYTITLSNPGSAGQQYYYFYTKSVFGRLPAFLFGISGAFIYHHYSHYRQLESNRAQWVASLSLMALISTLALLLQHSVEIGGAKSERTWHLRHSYEAFCWVAIILILTMTKPFGKPLLINPFNAVMGKLSYSIYLTHVPILFYLIYPIKQATGEELYNDSWSAYFAILAGTVACFAASYAIYRFLELPFLNIKQKIPSFKAQP